MDHLSQDMPRLPVQSSQAQNDLRMIQHDHWRICFLPDGSIFFAEYFQVTEVQELEAGKHQKPKNQILVGRVQFNIRESGNQQNQDRQQQHQQHGPAAQICENKNHKVNCRIVEIDEQSDHQQLDSEEKEVGHFFQISIIPPQDVIQVEDDRDSQQVDDGFSCVTYLSE